MPKLKDTKIRKRLNVTIASDLCDFLDFLMIDKRMNKSAVIEHMIICAIGSADLDYYKLDQEFQSRNYDMFIKSKADHDDNRVDKTSKLPVIEKNDRTKK
jgi:hypothetical protein